MADSDFDNLAMGEEKPLGMAGGLAKTFIHSPLSPLLLIACLALGLLGLFITPRQEDPQILVPVADIFFEFPGASSRQVASLATDPLERMMSEIPGVKHVYSASERGRGMVTVQFKVGEETENSLVKLYDKLMSNRDKIPPGVSQPLVKPRGADDVPAVTLTIWSEEVDDSGLRLIALEVMQRLKEVPNTSQSFITGGRAEQMRVEVQPERMRSFGISIDQLADTIVSANEKRKVGGTETGVNYFTVYSGRFLRNAADLERLIVGVRNGSPIYVRDVAKVISGPGEANSVVQYFSGQAAGEDTPKTNGAPAVTISLAKKTGTNGVAVANAILAKIESIKGRIIPDNVNVSITRNYGETANHKVNELISEMLGATLAVTVLIFFFLGLRPTIVVVVVIPVIILITIFSAWVLDYTIDRVSLFALIFSIGILVDDATVVVENVYRRWLMNGRVDTATTIDAVREVGNPTILATLAIIAALLPMGFVSGMMGPYMRPIPVLGSVAMIFSLFAAFIFTPWLVMRVRPSLSKLRSMQESEHRSAERMDGFIRRLLGPLLDSKRKAFIFKLCMWGALGLACSMFYFTSVAVKMLPLDNKPEFNVIINMPEGTALPATANAAQILGEKILTMPEVTAVQSYVGTSSPFNFNGLVRHYYLRRSPWQGDLQIQLLDKGDRDRTSHEIAVQAREMLTPLITKLGGRIEVVEMPPGPPVLQTVVAEVYGPNDEVRRQVAQDLTGLFKKSDKIVDVGNYIQAPHDNWTFEVDQDKAEFRNVSTADLNRQLSMIMGGFKLGNVKVGHELEPRNIIIQAPLHVRGQISRLGEVPIKSRDGKTVPLGDLGKFVRTLADPVIYHKDLRPVEYVTGEVAGRLAAPVYGMLDIGKLLEDYKSPDGVSLSGELMGPPTDSFKSGFEWTGEWTVTYETFRDMGLAFMGALILIYMLIVLEFGNFRMPGIIMAPIPLTLIGIIPGHWLLGAEFTATSMIGWIALAGIIVRNSILLVDFSRQAVLSGMDHRESVILAVRTRTRPILITQLTMIAGSIAIIADPIFQGMAISLLFGAIVATALTLIVIPLACFNAPNAYRSSGGENPFPVASASEPSEEASATSEVALEKISVGERFAAIRGGLSMVYYALRALPYFAWMMIKELASPLVARFIKKTDQPVDATEPDNTIATAVSNTGETTSQTVADIKASVRSELARAPAEPVDQAEVSDHDGAEPAVVEPLVEEAPVSASKAAIEDTSPEDKPVKAAASADVNEAVAAINEAVANVEEIVDNGGNGEAKANPADDGSSDKSSDDTQPVKADEPEDAPVADASTTDADAEPEGVDKQEDILADVASAIEANTSKADDLKRIKGIGAVLERELNALGINRYEQVADLTIEDLEDARMKLTIMQRAKKDEWLEQAALLAAGEATEFSERVDAGKVPSSNKNANNKDKG